jgi:hypothetical protein
MLNNQRVNIDKLDDNSPWLMGTLTIP